MIQGVYKIENLQNGKVYVGSSTDVERRWKNHCYALRNGYHTNSHLQAAWNKYGESAFAFSVLEEVGSDALLSTEQKHLDDNFGRDRCYNISPTVGSGGPVSEETRRKLSEAHMGHAVSDETRRKMSEANTGYTHTGEARRRMRGRVVSEETRRKISEFRRGRKASEETRRKLSASHMGHVVSDETRRRMSEAAKQGWAQRRKKEKANDR